jgi:hypothetical protein
MLLSSRLTIFLLQFQLAADCVLCALLLPLDTLLAIVCAADASSHADLYPHAGKMPLSHDTDTALHAASSSKGCLTGNGTLSVSVVRGCFFTGHLNFYFRPARAV